jgi:hypothetical protein
VCAHCHTALPPPEADEDVPLLQPPFACATHAVSVSSALGADDDDATRLRAEITVETS